LVPCALFDLTAQRILSVTDYLQTIEHETGLEPITSVIWMHGLGADAGDFVPAVPALSLGLQWPVRFIFPNAPQRPVTINGGMMMRAWYDMTGFDPEASQDEAGIRASSEAVHALVSREVNRGISADRIVVAGFSQGGAMALFSGLRYPHRLAGIISLSAYLPLASHLDEEAAAANRDVPVFIGHGNTDDVVPIIRGRDTREFLTNLDYPVTWKTYPITHSVSPEELDDVRAFLQGLG
jgi:phospholipase/carboxylesterase